MSTFFLVETPRDAFQGIRGFIPTDEKIAHIRKLIAAGFHRIDFGSFVSPQAVPQMQDSEDVLKSIQDAAGLYLIVIIANERGLQRALAAGRVNAVGFPFSISNTFQLRNTHRSIEDTWPLMTRLAEQCRASGLDFIIYVSMAFGNPYADPWSAGDVVEFLRKLGDAGAKIVYLADTTSEATAARIRSLVTRCRSEFPDLELGVHLHSDPAGWTEKLAAALDAGISRVDSAMAGMGGCPFARSGLVGNIPTEGVVSLLQSRGISLAIDPAALQDCVRSARRIMERYGHG
ncbi:MAG TPA: hydroxymethylglutaryl-CoA lyase [Acidobacteriota bacterium]|jgi:hydroxymethylglutaryl-CoA lyase